MTQLLLDKHTIDLLEKLVLMAEKNNETLKQIESKLDKISKKIDDHESNLKSIKDDVFFIENMIENSEYI